MDKLFSDDGPTRHGTTLTEAQWADVEDGIDARHDEADALVERFLSLSDEAMERVLEEYDLAV